MMWIWLHSHKAKDSANGVYNSERWAGDDGEIKTIQERENFSLGELEVGVVASGEWGVVTTSHLR